MKKSLSCSLWIAVVLPVASIAINGAVAAEFLQTFKASLEEPATLLL